MNNVRDIPLIMRLNLAYILCLHQGGGGGGGRVFERKAPPPPPKKKYIYIYFWKPVFSVTILLIEFYLQSNK